MIKLGRLYLTWGRISSHHHFAKAGEVWASPWAPSQPRPVRWQIVRGEGLEPGKLPVWILWVYPADGSAIHVECGLARRAAQTANNQSQET